MRETGDNMEWAKVLLGKIFNGPIFAVVAVVGGVLCIFQTESAKNSDFNNNGFLV